jgi:hypothetical protein
LDCSSFNDSGRGAASLPAMPLPAARCGWGQMHQITLRCTRRMPRRRDSTAPQQSNAPAACFTRSRSSSSCE